MFSEALISSFSEVVTSLPVGSKTDVRSRSFLFLYDPVFLSVLYKSPMRRNQAVLYMFEEE